jgi:predicted RNA-binding protein with TRAM domain
MADLRRVGKNNHKKVSGNFASEVITTSDAMDEGLFTLPEAAVVTRAYAVVLKAAGTGTIDIKVGDTVVGDEVDIKTVGVQDGTQANTYFPTGGYVTVVTGAEAGDNAGRIKIVIEYVETELSTGMLTN